MTSAPQHLSPRIPDGLARIIEKCMAPDPDQRFEHAKALAEALESYLTEWRLKPTVNGLCDLLQNPQENLHKLNAAIKQNAMAQAEQHLDEKQTGKALTKVSRVLADSPQDVDAQQLLEQIEAQGQKPVWHLVAMTVVPLLLIVGVVTIFSFYPEPSEPAPVASDPATAAAQPNSAPPTASPPPLPSNVETPTEASSATKPTPTVASKARKTRRSHAGHPLRRHFLERPKVATNKRALTLSLPVGKHRLRFENPHASTKEETVKVTAKGRIKPSQVNLDKMKPATLIVTGSPAEAIVGVGKNSKGTLAKSQREPMKISLPDKTPRWDTDVTVHKKGFIPQTKRVRFMAGKPVRLHVNLVPEPTP